MHKNPKTPLNSVPSSVEIRARLVRNAEENRLLRSLYKLSCKIEKQLMVTNQGGVSDGK